MPTSNARSSATGTRRRQSTESITTGAISGSQRRWAPLVTVRTAQYDIWARQFLAVNEHCTVVHLGCGLDSRVFRLDPGPGVEWYDVDYPAVIALREKVYPTRDRITTSSPHRRRNRPGSTRFPRTVRCCFWPRASACT